MIEPTNFALIATAKTSKEARDALIKVFGDTGPTRKLELLKRSVAMKLSYFYHVQNYISQMVMMFLNVQPTSLRIDNELVASFMLPGLPEIFTPLEMAIEYSKAQLTMDIVIIYCCKLQNFIV